MVNRGLSIDKTVLIGEKSADTPSLKFSQSKNLLPGLENIDGKSGDTYINAHNRVNTISIQHDRQLLSKVEISVDQDSEETRSINLN